MTAPRLAMPFDRCMCGHNLIDHAGGGGPCDVFRGGERVDDCIAFTLAPRRLTAAASAQVAADDVAGRLAEALERASNDGLLGHDGLYRNECEAAAAALLPVVDAVAEQRARQRAAEALEAAYWATAAIPDPESVREVVLTRATTLRGEDQ